MTAVRDGVDPVPDAEARVLAALANLPRATVRDVADEAGLSLSYTHSILVRLRSAGMVAWTPGQHGTLRRTFAVDAPTTPGR